MQRECNLTIKIEAFFDHVLARRIIQRGKDLRCMYLKNPITPHSSQTTDYISAEEAFNYISKNLLPIYDKNPLWKTANTPLLYVTIEGTVFSLYFQRNYEVTTITLTPLDAIWHSNNDAQDGIEYIDWERYILFMFTLLQGSIIVGIETYDSSCQE